MITYILNTIVRLLITPYILGIALVFWLRAVYRDERLIIKLESDDDQIPPKGGSKTLDMSAMRNAYGNNNQ